jgi:hypothetical protein
MSAHVSSTAEEAFRAAMTPVPLELRRGQRWLDVGPLRVAAWHLDPPVEGLDHRWSTESLGCKPDGYDVEFSAYHLRGVRGSDLPPDLSLFTHAPRLVFSAIDYLGVLTTHGRLTMEVSMFLAHDQFHLPCNLIHFMDRLAAQILTSPGTVTFDSSKAQREEFIGVRISATLGLQPIDDLEASAIAAAQQILICYRHLVRDVLAESQSDRMASPGESGAPERTGAVRWWTKEFVVPLATSGVLGAVAMWVLGRL